MTRVPGSRPDSDDLARGLREIVAEHGPQALCMPDVISNLMKDVLPDNPRMARVVVAAAEERTGDQLRDLLAQGIDAPTATRLAATRLAAATMFPAEACAWATGEIAVALGVLAAAERTPTIVVPPDHARAPQDVPAREIPVTTLALVADDGNDTVTAINLATGTTYPPFRVGRKPRAITITPDGATACVASFGDGTVTLIQIRTGIVTTRVMAGNGPQAITITPDSTTAYVANHTDGTITAISLPAGRPSARFKAVHGSRAIALDPACTTVYVLSDRHDTITPVSLVTGQVGRPVKVGTWAYAMATTPDGRTAYVTSHSGITSIDLATGLPGTQIPAGGYQAIVITPDSATAYLMHRDNGTVIPLDLATGILGTPIVVGPGPQAIAITPDGATAYVASKAASSKAGYGTLIPIDLATRRTGPPISIGTSPAAIAIATIPSDS